MPEHRPLAPASPWVEVVATEADWDAADPHLLRTDLRPAGLDPDLRGVRPRPGQRRPGPRSRPLEHRPGGRRGRLGARAHQRGHRQRLAPRPPPVPRQGAAPRRAEGARPAASRPRSEVRDGAAAHARRDLRPGPRLQPRPRRLDAPAVEGRRGDGHQRHRRRRRPAGRRLRLVAPARRHRRRLGHLLRRRRGQHRLHPGDASTSRPPGSCRSASSSRTTSTPSSTTVDEVDRRAAAVGARPRLRHRQLEGRRHGPARRPPRDAGGRRAHAAPAAARRWSRPTSTATSTRTAPFPGSAFGYRDKEEERAWRERDPITQIAAPPRAPRPALTAEETGRGGRGRQGRHGGDRRRARSSRCPAASPASVGSARPSGPTRLRRRRRARRPVRVRRRRVDRAGRLRRARSPRRSSSTPSPRVMDRRMETDPRIVVMGEDVHRLNGGTNGATRGLADRVPRPGPRHPDQRERVRRPGRRHRARRPLHARSSSSCTPTSCGWPPTSCSTRSARRGTCSAATTRVPLVLRSKVAMGTGYGSQHSMDPAGVFATVAGLADRRAVARRSTTSA